MLSADAFWSYGDDGDRKAALRLLTALKERFPASSLNRQVASHVDRLKAAPRATTVPGTRPASDPAKRSLTPAVAGTEVGPLLKSIRREALPDVLRITLDVDREIAFYDERLDAPARVFVDLQHTVPVSALREATLAFQDDVVRQVRVGRPQGDTTRVVFDLHGSTRHSVYVLYDPYRLVVDFERPRPARAAAAPPVKAAGLVKAEPKPEPKREPGPAAPIPGAAWTLDPLPSRPIPAAAAARIVVAGRAAADASRATAVAAAAPEPPPVAPAANMRGGFSLSRQLGLGISRIVIDPGHGGHDPGARIKGLSEADLVLDVALRLQKLLGAQPGVTVSLTRKSNVYVPLEQRTAIANREEADLFLSIHANASENENARGIETYFLNFAPNPEAERIAARENSGGARTMHSLPDIVKAIALNNKIDESRDFASLIQSAMYERLKKSNKNVRDLGVKQAPFMVLIGAQMPSVLAEISFITNKDEGALLKTAAYRQQIAEALLNGIMKYQKAVKATQIAKQ
jgi:N-acetylmuramoyl-L-alanine amidase